MVRVDGVSLAARLATRGSHVDRSHARTTTPSPSEDHRPDRTRHRRRVARRSIRHRPRAAFRCACVLAAALLPGCRPRESADEARDRATEAFLVAQVADLKRLIARVETGDLVSRDRIAISVSESIVKQLIDATLPTETTIARRFRVRIESAQPFFRGNNAALVFQAVARGLEPDTPTARVEIAGSLERVRIENGRLIADVKLAHFKILDTSIGDVAADVVERLVGDNPDAFVGLLPSVEIPVHLEQTVTIAGLDAGPVAARGGVMPLEMTVAEVIAVGERLWVLVDARAGPWQASDPVAVER